jgi:hypothetical protein
LTPGAKSTFGISLGATVNFISARKIETPQRSMIRSSPSQNRDGVSEAHQGYNSYTDVATNGSSMSERKSHLDIFLHSRVIQTLQNLKMFSTVDLQRLKEHSSIFSIGEFRIHILG